MVGWMCGVHLKSAKFNKIQLGIKCNTDVVRRSRLQWFGQFTRSKMIVMIGFSHVEV